MKTIIDFPGYCATKYGEIVRFRDGRIISLDLLVNGYHKVTLHNDLGRKDFSVHRLIMTAFCGPSELDVNHINGIKRDNRLENLEYVTCLKNVFTEHGKLTQLGIDGIRSAFDGGEFMESIAKRYNISKRIVWNICRRVTHND